MINIKNILFQFPKPLHSHIFIPFGLHYNFSKIVRSKIQKKVVLNKKKNKQLNQLKKQLANKQPIKSKDLYDQYHYREVYKRINIQIQSFFYERPYTQDNFNFLLNLISEQIPQDYKERINQVLNKMELMKIYPNDKSYNYMIKAASHANQIQLAEQYFDQACKKFLPNKYLYTSLMQTYVINNDPNMALKILDEMVEKGLTPDLATYTTLINCFRKGRKLQKCWQINKKMKEAKVQPDETYTGVMMKVYAAVTNPLTQTHDAQKSIKLYRQNITQKGIKPMIETINAYFKCLSSRRQYSSMVVDKFFHMLETGEIVTTETANWALRACSTIGNVHSAVQILKVLTLQAQLLRLKAIPIDKSILNTLLKVYSTACLIPDQNEKYRDIIMTDSWKLLEEIGKMGGVDTNVLNNMLSIYSNSMRCEQVDGLILPLYNKFKQEYNMYTFEILMQMYYRMRDFNTGMRIWHQMNNKIQQNSSILIKQYGEEIGGFQLKLDRLNEKLRPTFNALHIYLDIGIKMMDMKQILDALQQFKKYKRMPKNQTLKFLGNLKNLPEQIQVSLMDFQIQFGKAKISSAQLPNIEDPQNK